MESMINLESQQIKIEDVQVIENTRTEINDPDLKSLMASIQQVGLLSPIGVGESKSGKYVLIYGHRRLEACKKLGYKTISARVDEEPDMKTLIIINLTENLQRKDITAYEFGRGCCKLIEEKLTVGEIGVKLGCATSKIISALKIHNAVPEKYRDKVKFKSKGEPRRGDIPASIMKQALDLKRRGKLKAELFNEFIELIREKELTNVDLNIISELMNSGLEPEKAIKERSNYSCHRVDIIVKKEEMKILCRKRKLTEASYLRKIVYGDLRPINKPYFIKK